VVRPANPVTAALARLAPRHRALPGFLVAIAILITVGSLSWQSVSRLIDTAHWVAHTHSVIEEIQALDSDLTAANASERGFAITGREEYLTGYSIANTRLPRRMVALRELSADNPIQLKRLDELDPIIDRLTEFFADVVAARRVGGEEAALRLVAGGEGERSMVAARRLTGEIEQLERALLSRRLLDTESTAVTTRRTITLAGLAAMGLLAGAMVLVYRDTKERVRVAAELTLVNDRLSDTATRAQRRAEEIAQLAELSQLLQTCQLAEEAYRVIERAVPVLSRRSGALFLLNHSGTMLEQHAAWGNPKTLEPVFGPTDCWALRRNRVHDLASDEGAPRCAHLSQIGSTKSTCVPLMAQGESLGVLVLLDPIGAPQASSADDQENRAGILRAMAEQVALALANLRLRETLKSQSIRDPLTGLFNRRFLEESLERECRRAARADRALSLLMLDVDHFKTFNDTFGHDAGDAVLREVGAVLRTFFRGEDVACRYGGEEFALLLADTPSEGAAQRADRLRHHVERLSLTFRRRPLGPLTISVGIASLPSHASTAESLLRLADQALYRAKHEGRNRVVVAQIPDVAEAALPDNLA
jgi:diguanylate cyclase (GGDEF)-like protein